MSGADYEGLVDRLGVVATAFAEGSGQAFNEWNDAVGADVLARLREATAHGERVAAAVSDQAEEHRRLAGLVELVERRAESVRDHAAASSKAVGSASEELDRTADLAAEASSAARASGASADQALRLASLAGAECGKAVSFGELDGMVQQKVVRARKAEVARMAAVAAVHEVTEHVAEEAAQHVLGIPEGAIPDDLVDRAKSSVQAAGEITIARVRGLINRLPRSEP
jgi:hypothetical protein